MNGQKIIKKVQISPSDSHGIQPVLALYLLMYFNFIISKNGGFKNEKVIGVMFNTSIIS